MMRIMPKFKSFRPWVNKLLPQNQIRNDNSSVVLQAGPSTIGDSAFVKEMQPLPIPVLRRDQIPTKWTIGEYLRGDPQCIEVMLPKEAHLHRLLVMDQLGLEHTRKRGSTHALIVAGARALPGYPFRQNSDFLYLCDCLLPGVVLLVVRNRQMLLRTVLFQPLEERQPDPALIKLACQRFNVDEVVPISNICETLSQKLYHVNSKLWYTNDHSPLSRYICTLADELKLPIACPRHLMQMVRSFKTPRELEAIRRANSIAAQSLQEVMVEHTPQQEPRELCHMFAHKCSERYAHQTLPYEPRLALGIGGALLMDGACQYAGYYGGLARYWPINGRFTPPQKVLYNMLLEIRSKLCTMISRSNSIVRTPRELHTAFLILLSDQLRELRVLPSGRRPVSDIYKAVVRFNCFPTLVRHVGLDFVTSSENLLDYPLMPGNVFSLQLSISIPNDCMQAYPEFRGVLCILGDCIHIKPNYELDILSSECASNGHDVEELRDSRTRPNESEHQLQIVQKLCKSG